MKKTKSFIPVVCILLALVLGCKQLGNIAKNSASKNPYQGKLTDLLPEELSSGMIKFKLDGTVGNDSFPGATEAKGFTYMQQAAGVEIKVDGALANYPTAAAANEKFADITKKFDGKVSKKGDGQRFAAADGSIAWTNGSLLCIVKAGVKKAAENFEEAALF